MLEAHIDHSELKRLAEKLEKSPKVLKEAKRRAFQSSAPKLKSAVDTQIGGSGRVRDWQGARVGSKGGYAAVSPKARTYAQDHQGRPTKYAVGYVTNAINNGHRTRRGKLGFRSSARTIPGKRFYQQTQVQVEQVAQETAQQVVDTLVGHLEG